MPRVYRGRRFRAARTIQRAWRRRRQVGPYIGRPRFNRIRRVNQNVGRLCQYFRDVVTVTSDSTGQIFFVANPTNVASGGDFSTYGSLYQEFKVLKLTVKFLPSSVGSESLQTPAGLGTFRRGDSVTWIETGSVQTPGAVTDVINRSSAKLVQSRRMHKRWIDRPPGYPKWGELSTTGSIAVPDAWDTSVQMYGEGFSPVQAPGPQVYWYCLITYKVLFRSRND